MKKLIGFWVIYLLFLMALLVAIISEEKADLHLALSQWVLGCNDMWMGVMDKLMKYSTEIGSSLPFVAAGVCLFWKFGYSCVLLLGQLMTTIIVQPIKHIVRAPRPKTYFAEVMPDVQLHQVDGVHLHSVMSFPSGHTAAAFAFCLGIVLLAKKRWVSVVCVLLAIVAGYSRIYLSQHFALDVAAGSVVGVASALFVNWIYEYKKWGWKDLSLISLFKSITIKK